MDSTMISALLCGVVSLVFLTCIFRWRKHRKLTPPSPPSIPIFGHFFFLKKPLHRTFQTLSAKYGPIFSLRLGSRRLVVVSSPSLVQECYSTNGVVFANRPKFITSTYVAYNNTTIGTAPYGAHWRNVRKIANMELLSSGSLQGFKHIRSDEVSCMVAKLARKANSRFVEIDFKKTVSEVVLNNAMRMIAGKRYYDDKETDPKKIEDSNEFQDIMQDVFDKSGAGNPADYFPIMKLFSSKYVDTVKEIGVRVDEFIQNLLDETKRSTQNQNTMLSHLLSLQKTDPENHTDLTIKGLVQTVILAGTDSSVASLIWAMGLLLNNPHVIKKAQEEINEVVGTDRLLDDSDLPNLPYLQNIISETLRLYPAAPLLVPHLSSADCTVGGYHIPRGTILLTNAWGIHRDPSIWPDPEAFRPERFEPTSKVIGSYSYIPFGYGRRICPGANMALNIVGFTLGALLQCFDWKTVGDAAVDMTEGTGMTIHMVEPLMPMCKLRPVAQKFSLIE